MRSTLACLAALLLLSAACSSTGDGATPDAGGSADAGPDAAVVAGDDATVATFDKTNLYFTGQDNKRTVDVDATFPEAGAYSKIVLHLTLECPSGRCDPWDRFGTLGVVTHKGDKPDSDTVVEVARFITPYGVGASWDYDVTDLRPLLSGKLTLRAFIDTWVGPGSSYGNGWSLSATFQMTGGVPEKVPVSVMPVWAMHSGAYGDPKKPIASSFPAQTIALPAGATSASLRTFVTGHGQGNAANCAEFCPRTHTLTVAGNAHAQKVWRTDCAKTAAPGQQGTYTLSRAGWCPGADVKPWLFDVTDDFGGASSATLAYDVEGYENTCRPDATSCSGCTLGTGCPYDGGNHTEPSYSLSTVLIAYR